MNKCSNKKLSFGTLNPNQRTMLASSMFAKFKSAPVVVHNPWDSNPIVEFFDISKQVASCGPEHVWKIHDGYRKSDAKECSIFIFEKKIAEKLHKPKRKETVTEMLRNSVRQLERLRQSKLLLILHAVEECAETLAFATEPVMCSLANILAFQEAGGGPCVGPPATGASAPVGMPIPKPQHAKEYHFIDMEMRYGLVQITEALTFLHYNVHLIHRNVCPTSILITKKGTWKLFGLEFVERVIDIDSPDPMSCAAWSSRFSKMVQPNLDYIAPEIQQNAVCSVLSDMFSLGMTICAIFNNGRPLIQANYSASNHSKQMELIDDQVHLILPRIPNGLQEAVTRLMSRDSNPRPTSQLLSMIKYFGDPVIPVLQSLDVLLMKEPNHKANFYRTTLMDMLPYIPRKLWWQHVWPNLQQEINMGEVLAAVLMPVMFMVKESSMEEYEIHMVPTLKQIFSSPKSIQASVTILENLQYVLEKTPREEIRSEVLPLLYNAFDSTTIQIQSAALNAVNDVSDYLDEYAVRRMIIPKTRILFEKNQGDLRIIASVLRCIERTIDRLDKGQIMDEVLPLLWEVRLNDPSIAVRVISIYRLMMSDKKYGLTVSVMATRVIPLLMPQTVNPSINLEQFGLLIEILREMFELVEKSQLTKLKVDMINIDKRPLHHQLSTDNMNAPPFNIPNLRVEQRKTSSAEDMARKNSTVYRSAGAAGTSVTSAGSGGGSGGGTGLLGSWWFGASSASQDGNNFLRVASAFPNRRLSDNTLMTPKIRIAPSCASSPGGGSPGSTAGLPVRRHSSIGPQERRGSHVNLSPPTGRYGGRGGSGSSLSVPSSTAYAGGSMPNTSSSVPFLLSSSMQSIRSRRPSAALGGSQGSGLLQQLGSGMVRHLTGSVQGHHWAAINSRAFPPPVLAVRKCPSLNITFND